MVTSHTLKCSYGGLGFCEVLERYTPPYLYECAQVFDVADLLDLECVREVYDLNFRFIDIMTRNYLKISIGRDEDIIM